MYINTSWFRLVHRRELFCFCNLIGFESSPGPSLRPLILRPFDDMKVLAFLALSAGLATASPTPTKPDSLDARTIQKRATITDACPVGFCTENGGTTGGTGGTTTTVSTLAQFTAAANASGPYVILVSGALSGAAKVEVGSDKTIIGKTGSSTYITRLTIFVHLEKLHH